MLINASAPISRLRQGAHAVSLFSFFRPGWNRKKTAFLQEFHEIFPHQKALEQSGANHGDTEPQSFS
jgi:hypothetical protein